MKINADPSLLRLLSAGQDAARTQQANARDNGVDAAAQRRQARAGAAGTFEPLPLKQADRKDKTTNFAREAPLGRPPKFIAPGQTLNIVV